MEQPIYGAQAVKAPVSGPVGSPEQAGGHLERWVAAWVALWLGAGSELGQRALWQRVGSNKEHSCGPAGVRLASQGVL